MFCSVSELGKGRVRVEVFTASDGAALDLASLFGLGVLPLGFGPLPLARSADECRETNVLEDLPLPRLADLDSDADRELWFPAPFRLFLRSLLRC